MLAADCGWSGSLGPLFLKAPSPAVHIPQFLKLYEHLAVDFVE